MENLKLFGTSANLIVNLFGSEQERNYYFINETENVTSVTHKYHKIKNNDLTVLVFPNENGFSEQTLIDIQNFLTYGGRVITFDCKSNKTTISITKIGENNKVLHQKIKYSIIENYLSKTNVINLIYDAEDMSMLDKLLTKFTK